MDCGTAKGSTSKKYVNSKRTVRSLLVFQKNHFPLCLSVLLALVTLYFTVLLKTKWMPVQRKTM